jgi:hypothetical protein
MVWEDNHDAATEIVGFEVYAMCNIGIQLGQASHM